MHHGGNRDVPTTSLLKAQGQCRATWEAIAAIKNPPVVYRSNKRTSPNGGPQQVNNGVAPVGTQSMPTKLLEEHEREEWMDTGAQSPTSRADPFLATVGAIDRASYPRGEAASEPERIPRGGERDPPGRSAEPFKRCSASKSEGEVVPGQGRIEWIPSRAGEDVLRVAAKLYPQYARAALIEKLLITGLSALRQQPWRPPELWGNRKGWKLPTELRDDL